MWAWPAFKALVTAVDKAQSPAQRLFEVGSYQRLKVMGRSMCPREEMLCCSSEEARVKTGPVSGREGWEEQPACESQESRVLSHLCVFWITEGTGKD